MTYSPCLELAWRHGDVTLGSSDRVQLSKEDGGFYHCDIGQVNETKESNKNEED